MVVCVVLDSIQFIVFYRLKFQKYIILVEDKKNEVEKYILIDFFENKLK